jgi:hypothetical protein
MGRPFSISFSSAKVSDLSLPVLDTGELIVVGSLQREDCSEKGDDEIFIRTPPFIL